MVKTISARLSFKFGVGNIICICEVGLRILNDWIRDTWVFDIYKCRICGWLGWHIKVSCHILVDKVCRDINSLNSSYIFLLDVNFENRIVKLQILYILNTYVKFCSNRMLFTIWSINLFFMHNFRKKKKNLKFKHLINDIAINF